MQITSKKYVRDSHPIIPIQLLLVLVKPMKIPTKFTRGWKATSNGRVRRSEGEKRLKRKEQEQKGRRKGEESQKLDPFYVRHSERAF
jgi:hypothetical protein